MVLQMDVLQQWLTRPLAFTSIAGTDVGNVPSVDRRSFFRWGIGPSLLRGSIVAMYVPKTAKKLAISERGCVRHIFSVVRDTIPAVDEFQWRNVVFLNNSVSLANPSHSVI
jgi:hypothetical protein